MDKGDATVRVDRVFLQTPRACPRILSLTVARHSEIVALPEWLDKLPNANSLCAHICLSAFARHNTRAGTATDDESLSDESKSKKKV